MRRGLHQVAWQNALLPWIILATVFFTGIVFSMWKARRDGKLQSTELTRKLRTQWAPAVVLLGLAAAAALVYVIGQAYEHSRWPLRHRGMGKAVWIGLIPVTSVLAASCLSFLLFADTDAETTDSQDTGPEAGEDAPSTGPDCVKCSAPTRWYGQYQRYRCESCGVYQPTGPRAG